MGDTGFQARRAHPKPTSSPSGGGCQHSTGSSTPLAQELQHNSVISSYKRRQSYGVLPDHVRPAEVAFPEQSFTIDILLTDSNVEALLRGVPIVARLCSHSMLSLLESNDTRTQWTRQQDPRRALKGSICDRCRCMPVMSMSRNICGCQHNSPGSSCASVGGPVSMADCLELGNVEVSGMLRL